MGTINRQAAINEMINAKSYGDSTSTLGPGEYRDGWNDGRNFLLDELLQVVFELPSVEPERHYCRECKWSWCHINVGKHGETETYWHCLNWDGETDEEGFCHEWERRTS